MLTTTTGTGARRLQAAYDDDQVNENCVAELAEALVVDASVYLKVQISREEI